MNISSVSKNSEKPVSVSSDAFYFEKDKSGCTLIMGVGNYLMGDEGVGVQLIETMKDVELPDHLDLLDGGTGGFLLLDRFEAYKRIVFVDATMDGRAPGSIRILKPRFASDFPTALSVHDVGLKDMIEAVYLMEHTPEMYLLTISIDHIEPMSIELSTEVRASIVPAIDQILKLCVQLDGRPLVKS